MTSRRNRMVLLARGLTYDEIGLGLEISVNTRSRIRPLYDKLDASSSTEAISAAARRGLIRF